MAFQVSPGVQFKEIDATNVVPAVSSSIGGFAGSYNWGPVEEIRTVSSEDEMASVFGTPDHNTADYFLTASSFLKYGSSLKVVRVGTGLLNAVSTDDEAGVGTPLLIKNETHYAGQTIDGVWAAKYAGALGNSLKVEVCTAGGGFSGWAYKGNFAEAPGTSPYAGNITTSVADELHIVVIDEDGLFTGTKGQVLESFGFLSQGLDVKDINGSSLYYKEVINNKSNYIWFGEHDDVLAEAGQAVSAVGAAFTSPNAVKTYSLIGGSDATSVVSGDITGGLSLFADVDTVDVNLLFAYPDANQADDIGDKLIEICELRKDCMAFISPPIADTVNAATPVANVLEYETTLPASSYASLDSGAVYVYDKYNDVYRWIGAGGLCAGLCANTDQVADAWFSPAGVNRGQLLGVAKLAHNPTSGQRDELYIGKVNPLVSFPGQGTMLFGDKTLAGRASAFDRINVRRLFVVLEKAISTAAKAQLFEFNDEFTRAQFRNLVEPFLRNVKGRRGCEDFRVVCDSSNNTSAVVDGNKFVADIFIKPSRSINFITLNFVATRSGVEFSEIAGN